MNRFYYITPALATALCLSGVAHASVTAVNFGGDMSDSRKNSTLDEGAQVQLSTGDFDGDTVTDSRFLIPIDHAGNFANIPNPTVGNINTIWRAGTEVINYGTSTPSPGTVGAVYRYNGQGISADYLQAGTAGSTGTSTGFVFAPHVEKSQFLNGASTGQTVSFADDANGFSWDWQWQDGAASDPKNTTFSRQTRATVKNGNTWYLSDTEPPAFNNTIRGNGVNDGITFNPATTTWYEWDVSTSLFFDDVSAGTGVLGSTFTDIQALGAVMMVNADTDTSTNGIIARLDEINVSVDFTVPPPPTAPIGFPVVDWQMDTVDASVSVDDLFGNTFTSSAVPDSSNVPNPGVTPQIDPLLLGDATPVSGPRFPAATRPTQTTGGMGVTGEALSFDGVDDEAFGIVSWLADTSETTFIPGLGGVYVSLDFQEIDNTDGVQTLVSARSTWELRIDADGNLEWVTFLAAGGADTIEAPLGVEGDWRNIEAWHDENGNKALFIDGVLAAISAPGTLKEDRASIVLGNYEGRTTFYGGLIDNVYVGSGIIPEPASMALIGLGGMLMAGRRRR